MVHDHPHARSKELGFVPHFIGHIIIAIVLGFIFGLAVMWLWNGLMPGLFGMKGITYWQGVGLLLLARLLFGSFGQGLLHSPHAINHHDQMRRRHAHGRWGSYNAWWQGEGQQAFDAYLARQAGGGRESSETDERA